ncbi:MAG TPA: hypothetical protein DCR97_02240 [Deltaproteobacteria bacterium]|nr:hypothetical protein [Deltaproteobacteria bacterium]
MLDRVITALNKAKRVFIGCPAVIADLRPLLPTTMAYKSFDFGLHRGQRELRNALQHTIFECSDEAETIILSYGLCSQGVIGLRASSCPVVVPRVDDCIALFLGSRGTYHLGSQKKQGTYYLTNGWIRTGQTLLEEYQRMAARYGRKRADKLQATMFKGYRRLVFVNTGECDLERCRTYARQAAEQFGLRYEEIEASNHFVRRMISGQWDKEFVVVEPGEKITLEHFLGSSNGKLLKKT